GKLAIKSHLVEKFPLEDIFPLLFFLGISFLFVGIITRDPLFADFGVPAEYEWIVGMFIVALASWKIYFNPMKQRIGNLERKVDTLDAKLGMIQEDLQLIKEKLFATN
ncbi:MAG: hypothetical protein AABX98_01440, partial [Nanoarchaeota archaeon]